MKATRKTGYWVGLFILLAAATVVLFFQARPMIRKDNNPRITFISAITGQNGESYTCHIPESDISPQLNDALVSLFLDAEMRNSLLPRPQNYTVSDGSVYFTIHVSLEQADTLSMLVNLSNKPDYSSAQFGDSHYHIVNHKELYQDVYDLLSDTIASHSEKW